MAHLGVVTCSSEIGGLTAAVTGPVIDCEGSLVSVRVCLVATESFNGQWIHNESRTVLHAEGEVNHIGPVLAVESRQYVIYQVMM